MRDLPHAATRHAPAQWRNFYLTARRRVDYAAYKRLWGTSLAERFFSYYMAIIRGALVGIFAKPEDVRRRIGPRAMRT